MNLITPLPCDNAIICVVVGYDGFIVNEYRTALLVEGSALAETSASGARKSNASAAAF